MKFKVVAWALILVFIVSGCNLNQGELIYKNPEELIGKELTEDFLTKKQVDVINPSNVAKARQELRGIKNLKVEEGLAIYTTLGERPSGGFEIEIKEIRKKADKLFVTVKAVGPAANQAVIQVITYPYDIIKLPSVEITEINKIIFLSTNKEKLESIEVNN
ncbi:hypothetical protein JCM16358_02930 [Halanaerocella petrolearia]